jgi:hypothetical protein
MKISLPLLGLALVVSLIISLAVWCWLVLTQFNVAHPFTELPAALWHTFDYAKLRPIAWKSLILGFAPVGIVLFIVGEWSNNEDRVLRGRKIVSTKELRNRTRLKQHKNAPPPQVEMAGVPIPPTCEPSHFLLTGSTNTGKSTAIDQLLASAIARGDRVIVIDPNAHAFSRFGKKGDIALNTFDQRSPHWCLLNEVRTPFDFDRLAKSVIPDSSDANSQAWHSYAQQLVAETMRAMSQAGEHSSERLRFWLTSAPAADLGAFLAGSSASGLFEPHAEKALASTKFILAHHIAPYQYLKEGDFSLRTWLENGHGNLYLTWREDMLTSLRPLISGWIDILLASTLTLPTANPKPIWLFLDELAGLERLNSLESGLTRGRKHGLRVCAGLQATSQLESIYGRSSATTLLSCFRNLLALGCSASDPETAKAISQGLGQIEVDRVQTTYTDGKSGRGTSKSSQRTLETLVLPSDLTSLPPLHGFLKLAGDYPIARIQLTPGNYPVKVQPFMEC